MEVDYIVTSEVELGELTPLESAAIHLLDDAYRAVDEMIISNIGMPEHFLANTARQALQNAHPAKRHWVALNSLNDIGTLLGFIKERANFVLQEKIQIDLGKKKMHKPLAWRSGSSEEFWVKQLVRGNEDVTEQNVRCILQSHLGNLMERLELDNESINQAILWFRKDQGRAFHRMQMSHRATKHSRISLSAQMWAKAVEEQKARRRRENKRPVRGAIKKVCKLFMNVGQEDNLRLFVSGHEVEMSYPDSPFKFIVRPLGEVGWLEDRTAKGRDHTPYDLSLLTKDDVHLAKLCVYIPDTPVLDQLLALAMFIQSGSELKILEKANFYASAPQLRESIVNVYPSLEERFRLREEVMRRENELTARGAKLVVLSREQSEQIAHWEPFKGRVEAWVSTWFEPIFTSLKPKAEMLVILNQ